MKESDNSLLISEIVVVIAVIALIIHTITKQIACHNVSIAIAIRDAFTALFTKWISFFNDKRNFKCRKE